MINKIIDGISISLNAEFGDGYRIETDRIKQGLKEPCFTIRCIKPTNELFRGNKYFRTNQFCIHYFPSGDDPETEINDVIDRLYDALEVISVGDDQTRGTDMHGEVDEGVLSFFVNYDMFVYKQVEKDNMEELEINQNVEG